MISSPSPSAMGSARAFTASCMRVTVTGGLVAGCAILWAPPHLLAQDPPVPVGSYIRVFSPGTDSARAEGSVRGYPPGEVLIQIASSTTVSLNTTSISRVEIRRASTRGRNAVRGLAAGGLGLLLLVIVTDGCASPDTEGPTIDIISDEACIASAAVVGGGLGALIGVATGQGERWEVVRPNPFGSSGGFTLSLGLDARTRTGRLTASLRS